MHPYAGILCNVYKSWCRNINDIRKFSSLLCEKADYNAVCTCVASYQFCFILF